MKPINSRFYLPDIYESDVISMIVDLRNSIAGYYTIPASIDKELINSFITQSTRMINRSFHERIFPNQLKLAKVIPVFKNGSKNGSTVLYPSYHFFGMIFEKNNV